jgi:hypothetical protein
MSLLNVYCEMERNEINLQSLNAELIDMCGYGWKSLVQFGVDHLRPKEQA